MPSLNREGTSAGERDEQQCEAVEDGQFAAVVDRPQRLRLVGGEIGVGHRTGAQQCGRPDEQMHRAVDRVQEADDDPKYPQHLRGMVVELAFQCPHR